jgi:colanic acid/amylovoran biosynthesis glycosyltransferase
MASTHHPGGRGVGLLKARAAPADASGSQAAIDGLRRLGLRAFVYEAARAPSTRHAPGSRGTGLAAHLRLAAVAPLRYGWTLARMVLVEARPVREFNAAVRVCAELRRDGIVHLHACDDDAAALAESASRLLGLGFSMSLPAGVPQRAPARAMARRLERARFTLAPSDAAVRAAAAIAPRATLHRAYPGVDYRRFSPRLRSHTTRLPLVLAVAQASAEQNIRVMIEACHRLLATGDTLRCDIVCETGDLVAARTHIDQQGLGHAVRAVAPVGDSHLTGRYSHATVFVHLPSEPDAVPRGAIAAELLEAMAIGLPVVTTGAAAAAECVTHGLNGWLVPPKDPAALAVAIRTLLTQPRLGEQLGERARETVLEQFDADVNLRTLKGLLDAAVQRTDGASPQQGPPAQPPQGLHHA